MSDGGERAIGVAYHARLKRVTTHTDRETTERAIRLVRFSERFIVLLS